MGEPCSDFVRVNSFTDTIIQIMSQYKFTEKNGFVLNLWSLHICAVDNRVLMIFLNIINKWFKVTGVRKGGNIKKAKIESLYEQEEGTGGRAELVTLDSIEMIYGKKKSDKAAKVEAIMKGNTFFRVEVDTD